MSAPVCLAVMFYCYLNLHVFNLLLLVRSKIEIEYVSLFLIFPPYMAARGRSKSFCYVSSSLNCLYSYLAHCSGKVSRYQGVITLHAIISHMLRRISLLGIFSLRGLLQCHVVFTVSARD